MKVISIITFLFAAVAVSADSCNQGGTYCGTSLLKKGEFYALLHSTKNTLGTINISKIGSVNRFFLHGNRKL